MKPGVHPHYTFIVINLPYVIKVKKPTKQHTQCTLIEPTSLVYGPIHLLLIIYWEKYNYFISLPPLKESLL